MRASTGGAPRGGLLSTPSAGPMPSMGAIEGLDLPSSTRDRFCNRTTAVFEFQGPDHRRRRRVLSGRSCPILLKKSISRTLAKFSVLMEIYYEITFRFLRHA
jgi:hypothetical protein